MSEFSTDVRPVFRNGTTARTSLLDLVPKVERVDGYAGSKFKSSLEPVRTETDGIRQSQRETARELRTVIDTWLLIHGSANDPDFETDIIDECFNMLTLLNKNASKADGVPENINNVSQQILSLKDTIESTIKEKDKAIDDEIDEATVEVNTYDDQVKAIDAKLKELRDKLNQGNLGKAVDAGKSLLNKLGSSGSTTTTASGGGGGGGDDQEAIKAEIKKLENERVGVVAQLDKARERKRQAVAVGDARTNAKAADPVGSTNSTHMKIVSWGTSSDDLVSIYKAFVREITTYQNAFQAKKDDPSDDNKKALADEIKKVDGYVPKLQALQTALLDGSSNL